MRSSRTIRCYLPRELKRANVDGRKRSDTQVNGRYLFDSGTRGTLGKFVDDGESNRHFVHG